MIITYGTRFYGKVATHNGHWIETKFFSIMFLPVFPISSIYVTEASFNRRQGIDINIHKHSVIATYARLITFVGAAWILFPAYAALFTHSSYAFNSEGSSQLIVGIVFAALCIYFFFFFGKATADDIILRDKIGLVTGVFALPHWFDSRLLHNLLTSVQQQYKTRYPGADWREDPKASPIDNKKLPLLFIIALFNCMVFDVPENDELFSRADAAYQGFEV